MAQQAKLQESMLKKVMGVATSLSSSSATAPTNVTTPVEPNLWWSYQIVRWYVSDVSFPYKLELAFQLNEIPWTQ